MPRLKHNILSIHRSCYILNIQIKRFDNDETNHLYTFLSNCLNDCKIIYYERVQNNLYLRFILKIDNSIRTFIMINKNRFRNFMKFNISKIKKCLICCEKSKGYTTCYRCKKHICIKCFYNIRNRTVCPFCCYSLFEHLDRYNLKNIPSSLKFDLPNDINEFNNLEISTLDF
jgi:hypothetical protein